MATDDKEIDAAKSALLDLLQRKSDAAKNLAAEALRSVELQKRVIALKDELASETLAQSEQERRALTMVTAKAMAGLTPPDPFAALHLQARRPWWELIETFFDEVKQTPANRANYMREFNRLADVIGRDRPLGLIRFDDLDKHHDALLLKAKPRKGNTTLSSKSQQRCLSHLKTFFSWAYGKEWLDRDPSKALRVKGLTRRETKEIKRRSFSPNELGLLFNAPVFTGCKSADRLKETGPYIYRGGRYWLPIMALWTGGRLSELTQLRCSHISYQSGLWYADLAILPDTGEDVGSPRDRDGGKTEHSHRLAPLHPDFLALGFLDFVEHRRTLGGDSALLFDEIADHGKFFNDDWFDKGRRVTGLFASVGIKTSKTSFHSLRHSFNNIIRTGGREGMDSRLQDRLMGHAPEGAAAHYGMPLTDDEARAFLAVKALVDLSHLLPTPERPAIPSKARPAIRKRQPTAAPRKRVLVPGKVAD